MSAKKWLGGCLVVVLLLGVAVVAAWWFVLRPMWNAGSDWVDDARTWTETVDLGDGVTNKAAFEAPADGRLTPAQVQSLVQVQQAFVQDMGADLGRLAQRANEARSLREGGDASLKDVAAAYSELTRLLKHAREAQLKAVNQAGLSRDEYHFIRKQALAALPLLVDVTTLPGMPGLPAIAGATTEGSEPSAAQANAELLRPHLPLLEKSLTGSLITP